ncbi:transcription factor HIVEP3 isoform X2 [Ascaphus truei]|uniref:transcription factor HIVEP3 isoform X2 n=1 Tax=Ascaphus truei TaxID=8439 RepID=UPI003F5A57C8
MEPEQSQKSTRKSEEGVRKRLTKGEALQGSVPPEVAYSASSQGDVLPQQHFPSSLKIPREGPQRRVGRPCKLKGPAFEKPHVSKPQPTSPAFMPPGAALEHGLEEPAWQVIDPIQPGPSGSFSSSALHARPTPSNPPAVLSTEESTQKPYVHRPSPVSLKQVEESHKKEKKPQKPGKYICQYCSRPCAKPSVLQKHIRSHTGERPYPCIPCGFSFKTKSNLYKHRKSHAHRIKAGLASEIGAEMYPSSLEIERLGGEEIEDPTEGESTDSEDETGTMSSLAELSPRQKHGLLSRSSHCAGSRQGTSHDLFSLSHPSLSLTEEESVQFAEPPPDLSQKSEETHTIKQKLALRLSERKKANDEQTFLSPGSKGSTESGYFSRSESAEQQISPPNTNAKSYAEIILGKCGRIGQRTSILATPLPSQGAIEEKQSMVPLSVPRTQVIEHITKLITINEAVVDTSEIDSVKPRRSSLSRRSSIESPKAVLYREPFQFDVKSPGSIGHLDAKSLADKTKAEQSFLSLQQSHSATETVPLLRSHSMPSPACTISSSHTFRASYSFDDRIVDSDVLSHSHTFSSHPRLLKRQPAIELPLGMEYSSEESSSTSKDAPGKTGDELIAKDCDSSKKSRKGGRVKGLIYECNMCGARYKKRGNYETHRKYYCSDVQILKPHDGASHSSSETRKGLSEHETWPQMLHYKLGPGLELTPLRKRRKEKSLGDDEEPPSFDLPEYQPSATATGSHFATSNTALNLSRDAGKTSVDQSEPMSLSDIHCRTQALESKEKTMISKEISVIQHTSSFEKSESMEQLSSFDEEDKPVAHSSSCTVSQHPRSTHSLQPKLVRQHNIQVPEILVTEEPDKPETEPDPPPKEQEKAEEFQWPQRSQTLSQLPAEKLPPKKKRLRLVEMAQSSGDSSFESMSLTRSPSQESSLSHASSHSVSFDREEVGKADVTSQAPTMSSPTKSFGHHMLTVPSQHHHVREMRRSASEQTPNVSHTSQISENRSKSFDYGSLSPAATSGPTAQERRKCFSVRQTSLSRHVEHDPELILRGLKETEQLPSSSKPTGKSFHHQSPVISHEERQSDSPQPKQSPETNQPLTEELQEETYLPQQLSLFPVQPLLRLQEHASELFPSQATSDLLSAPFPIPRITSLFHTPLQQALVHPGQLQLPQHLTAHPVDIAFRQHTSFLPLPYPGSSPIPPSFFLPIQPQFALPMPTEISRHFSQIKPMLSPPVGMSSLSSCIDYFPESLHPPSCNPLESDATSEHVPIRSDPVVSLVVPVRIQTHMPSYGAAMYTTLSQILVTQPHCSPSSVVIRKFDNTRTKGFHGFDLAHVLPEDQSSLCQTPYLQVPFPTVERSSYIPLTFPAESPVGFDGSPSSVGGSKRMLSPAGSLELTMETQQQKRVKEEEVQEEEGQEELLKPPPAAQPGTEEGRMVSVAPQVTRGHCRAELSTPTTATPDQSLTKDRSQSPLAPTLAGPPHDKSPEYKKQAYRCKVPVKKEDSEPSSYTPPSSGAPVSLGASGPPEGTDAKKVQTFPTLHTTTNVSWCYLNYVKPNHAQQSDRRASVYASWCISLYNPNLPGVSTRAALSLLKSKQNTGKEIYTTAADPHPEMGQLVPSSARKPKMTEVHLPTPVRKESARSEKEEEKRGRHEEEAPVARRSEPSRVRIFEGGYKSNEEYVYVRGRGRGKYVCEECGIRCKKPSMLKKHIRTHTDLRPYVCKHCNFAFKTKGNLTKHMKSKAHSKKCQELGVMPPSLAELEAEEGTSEEQWLESDALEEHQFSDLEDTDEDDDEDDEEEDEDEDEEESQEEKPPDPQQAAGTPISPSRSSPRQEPAWPLESTDNVPAPVYRLSSPYLPTEPPDREAWKLLGSDLPAPRDLSPRRHWSPSKEVSGGSRLGLSRRHLLPKSETSPKRFSPTGERPLRCHSPRRGMSPCQRMPSGREVSPLRCVSPRLELSPSRHLSPCRDLSPRAYMSPERRASPPVRHVSPSREVASVRYSALRALLPSPPRYPSPGREEPVPSRSDALTHFKAQHGVFPSNALPQRTRDSHMPGHQQKPEVSDFLSWSRPLHSPREPHAYPRSEENLFSHLPLHSQRLERAPYPMIPIGGIQMVQARPRAQPALLGTAAHFLSGIASPELASATPEEASKLPPRRVCRGSPEESCRTSEREHDEEEHRVKTPPSTNPQHPPLTEPCSSPSTYCQAACTPSSELLSQTRSANPTTGSSPDRETHIQGEG